MGRYKRIIILTILFLCIFFLSFIVNVAVRNTNSDNTIFDNAEFTTKYNSNLNYCGWIPNWASGDGLASVKANSNILDCISPVLYEATSDGSLTNISPRNLNEIIAAAKASNIKIYPTITLFDHEIFTTILQSEENYQRHIEQLMNIVSNDNFDGIDLDYESTKYSDNEQYRRMIIELSTRLHAQNKELVVTVLSKWGDDIEYKSLPQTRQVQDWQFLTQYADYIRIMAYDYTYSMSKYPGPIGPLSWAESIIKYAKTKIPDEKIVLGVHLYSYQWSTPAETRAEAENMPFVFMYDYLNNSSNEGSSNTSYDYGVVEKILRENTGYSFNYQGENVFVYQKESSSGKYENRVLVYIDQQGVMERKELAARYNIHGIAYWRLGNELNIIQDI